MRKQHGLILGGVVAVLGLGLGLSNTARSQLPPKPPGTLSQELAAETGLEQKDIEKLLTALGPALAKQITAGREVTLQGVGTFRVVRIPESRNLVDGRPVTQPASNIIEFLPEGGLSQAANAPGAKPAAVVEPFQYNILPGQTPAQRVPSGTSRSPSTRTR